MPIWMICEIRNFSCPGLSLSRSILASKKRNEQNRITLLSPEDLLEQVRKLDHPDDTHVDELNHIRQWALTLKESDQELFLLRHYYQKPAAQISRETGKPRSSVNLRLALIEAKLDEAMRKEREGG